MYNRISKSCDGKQTLYTSYAGVIANPKLGLCGALVGDQYHICILNIPQGWDFARFSSQGWGICQIQIPDLETRVGGGKVKHLLHLGGDLLQYISPGDGEFGNFDKCTFPMPHTCLSWGDFGFTLTPALLVLQIDMHLLWLCIDITWQDMSLLWLSICIISLTMCLI